MLTHILVRTRMTRHVALAALFTGTALSTSSFAQTVTVDPTGAANGSTIFTDLQSAVSSFGTGGTNFGNSAANVINVRADHGPITGSVVALASTSSPAPPVALNIDGDLTIQGVDESSNPSLAVFAGTAIPNAQQNIRASGFPRFAWAQSGNLTVRNLAFIPSTAAPGSVAESFMALKAPGVTGINPSVTIEDCVFTSNDGNNQPITTTGLPEDDSKLSNPGVISLPKGSAGIWAFSRAERGDLEVNIKNSVFASFTQLFIGDTSTRAEALKGWVSGAGPGIISFRYNIQEGCVFANLDGNVAQISWGGSIVMVGTDTNPIIVRKLQRASSPGAVWLNYSADADDQPVAGSFSHVHFHDIICPAITEGGVRAFLNNVDNCVFANTTNDAVLLRAGTNFDSTGVGLPTISISNSVFHDVGVGTQPAAIYGYASNARTLNVTSSYFSDANASLYGLVNNGASSTWNVSNSTLSLTGASALLAQSAGTGAINLDSSVIDSEIFYANTTDPFAANFYKVSLSDVQDWSVY